MHYYRLFTFLSFASLPNPLCLSYINISASFPLLISHNLPPSFLTFHNLFWQASPLPRHYRPNSYKNIFKNTAQNIKNLPANRPIHFDSYQINPGHNRGSIYPRRRFNSCQLFCIGPQAHQAWERPSSSFCGRRFARIGTERGRVWIGSLRQTINPYTSERSE